MAMRPEKANDAYPEAACVNARQSAVTRSMLRSGVALAGAAALGIAALVINRRSA